MTTTHPLRRTPIVTLAAVADLVTFGSTSRAAELRAARARRLHAEASAHAAAELELMRATEAERFAVACAAPFRERVGLELATATREGRRAPLLLPPPGTPLCRAGGARRPTFPCRPMLRNAGR